MGLDYTKYYANGNYQSNTSTFGSSYIKASFAAMDGQWQTTFSGTDSSFSQRSYSMNANGEATISYLAVHMDQSSSHITSVDRLKHSGSEKWQTYETSRWKMESGPKEIVSSKSEITLTRDISERWYASEETKVQNPDGTSSYHFYDSDDVRTVSLKEKNIASTKGGTTTNTYEYTASLTASSLSTGKRNPGHDRTNPGHYKRHDTENATISRSGPNGGLTVVNVVHNFYESVNLTAVANNWDTTKTINVCTLSFYGTGINRYYSMGTSPTIGIPEFDFIEGGIGVTFNKPQTLPEGFHSEDFDQYLPPLPKRPPLDMSGISGPIDTGMWNMMYEQLKGGYLGELQGFLNTVNGLQDMTIGFINLGLNGHGMSWTNRLVGVKPYFWIPSPDWSRDLIIPE